MAEDLAQRGFFSVVRWRSDATRDEARNVAVVLVEAEGQFGAVKAAPLSSVSRLLREQGILDAMLVGLEKRFAAEKKPTLIDLREMHESLQQSIYVTEPQAVAVSDIDGTMTALYKAFVSPSGGGSSNSVTKGAVLDRVMNSLRKGGHEVRRGEYVQDFLFDVVFERSLPLVAEVLSFGTTAKNFANTEYDAGHFLYALQRTRHSGFAVIQPPSDNSHQTARVAHKRVTQWFRDAGVDSIGPVELAEVGPPRALVR